MADLRSSRSSRRAPHRFTATVSSAPPPWLSLAVALVLLGLFVALLAVFVARLRPPPAAASAGTVVREVVDGDTVKVRIDGHDESVRLIGIDTPETKHPTKPVGCFGPEASAHTAELLPPGTPVELERDHEERDPYGRLLAYLIRRPDGLFVNVELVRGGFAEVLTIAPNTAHTREFTAAAAEARQQSRGLWGACSGAVPSGP